FSLMKLLPARHILDRAREDGLLEPGTVVIESTSGTFGLALAMECRLRGRPLVLVTDPAVDPRLRRRMRDLGAAVDIVAEPAPAGCEGWATASCRPTSTTRPSTRSTGSATGRASPPPAPSTAATPCTWDRPAVPPGSWPSGRRASSPTPGWWCCCPTKATGT